MKSLKFPGDLQWTHHQGATVVTGISVQFVRMGKIVCWGRLKPALLVGHPEYSFLWDQPETASPFADAGHPRQKKKELSVLLLHYCCSRLWKRTSL